MRQLLTISNAITDADRIAASTWPLTQQGGQADGLVTPGGIFIGRVATNLHPNGQNDAVGHFGGWGGGVVTRTLDPNRPAPFSPQSVAIAVDGSVGTQGVNAFASSLSLAAGVNVVGSIYFWGTPGFSYQTGIRIQNADATTTSGATTNFTGTGQWQLLIPSAVAVAAGETGATVWMWIQTPVARAETFWVAHPMIESGQPVVAPYVPTSGGTTATKPAARVQVDSAALSPVQGFMAACVQVGFDSTVTRTAGSRIGDWANDSSNRLIMLLNTTNTFSCTESTAGVSVVAATAAQVFSRLDTFIVVAAWDASKLYISLNGSPFISAARNPAALTAPTFDIGSELGVFQFDGWINWFACGTGTLSNADVAHLATAPSTGSPRNYIGHDAKLTGIFPQPGVSTLQPPITIAYH